MKCENIEMILKELDTIYKCENAKLSKFNVKSFYQVKEIRRYIDDNKNNDFHVLIEVEIIDIEHARKMIDLGYQMKFFADKKTGMVVVKFW